MRLNNDVNEKSQKILRIAVTYLNAKIDCHVKLYVNKSLKMTKRVIKSSPENQLHLRRHST
jgi:hypothetical protein